MLSVNDKQIKWFKDAKLGLFIHWGLYAATEGWWNGKETQGIVEWIAAREQIPNDEYEQLAKKMTCENFNADEWAELAFEAGMKYCVFTAKHHEGFAMYDTCYDDYSVVKRTPYGKDVAERITQAMRKKKIVPCFYYSHAIDFHEENAVGNTWYFKTPEEERDFRGYINGKCKTQIKELLTNYGKVGLLWLDVPKCITEDIGRDIKNHIKSLQPDCLVNGRIGGTEDMGDYGCMGDNQIPAGKPKGCWETAATMNDTWGYKRDDHNFKSVREIIELLCSVVSKGANLLLNIGPAPDGSIPPESRHILKELGKWMKVNGEAIYGTEASPFKSDFTFGMCSKKDDKLYLYVTDAAKEITIKGIKNEVRSVSVLGKGESEFIQEDDTLRISLEQFNGYVTVIKINMDAEVRIKDGIYAQESKNIILPAYVSYIMKKGRTRSDGQNEEDVSVNAERFNLASSDEISISPAGIVEHWADTDDYIGWTFSSDTCGEYDIYVYTMAPKYMPWKGKQTLYFECNGDISEAVRLKEDVAGRGANKKYFDETGTLLGRTKIKKGENRFCLFADSISDELYISKIVMKEISR